LRLLLDENLSPRLIAAIVDLYPGSNHVENFGLMSATDDEVWRFAANNGFAIVSKDSDFSERSVLEGSPHKVIWLRVGNCTTEHTVNVFKSQSENIGRFLAGGEESCLVVNSPAKVPVKGVEP
jgi:predicted nuclease of predicted toxin-antitoxin system